MESWNAWNGSERLTWLCCRGNLIMRDLSELIKPDDFIETDYLTTLFVVVNK
jgi:hypothetical protein